MTSAQEKNPASVEAGRLAHLERDADGKSVHALRNNAKIHAARTADGKSLVASRAGTASMAALDEKGRSINGMHAAACAITPAVERRRAATRRRRMLARTEDEMIAHAETMTERGAAAQIGFHAEVHRQFARKQIDVNGELL